ncbi:primosomal protein N' [Helicobacter burdigaliensis]
MGLNSPLLTYKAQNFLQKGRIVKISIKNKNYQGVVLKEVEKPTYECKNLEESEEYFLPHQLKLAEFIASYYCTSLNLSYALFVPSSMNAKKATLEAKEIALKPLNAKQKEAFLFLKSQKSALLFGDTGSGKTEIYMHLMQETLKEGKNIIFLLPEISLTPQMEKRLGEVFGDILAFWHSKITAKRKNEILEKLKEGKIRIISGARSALFLPLEEVGLIIVDEEHDDAYKSSQSPNYHARDVALYYGNKIGARVILGSATPSLNSYYKAKNEGRLFRLKGGFYATKRKFIFEESMGDFSFNILEKLRKNLESKKQAVVFLPTRANFKYLLCKKCGSSMECPNCSVTLSLHKKSNALKCHYCNFATRIMQSCQKCGGELGSFRMGTQELILELQEHLKEAKICGFDRDSITTQKKLKNTLDAFNKGEIDILVGTQMLSKGHDYHNVALSVVLGIDYLLKGADFRARERATSLLFQIAGRSGRKEDGEVLIQTLNKEFFMPILGDYERFLEDEITYKIGLYPPFMRLALLHFSSTNEKIAQENMQRALKDLECKEIEIVGYGKAPIEKISNKYRYVIFVRSSSVSVLNKALREFVDYPCVIDVDPLDFS